MKCEKQYSLALRKRQNGDRFYQHKDYQFKELPIDCGSRYWLADPFLFEKDGITYIFFEAFDLFVRRGKIGYCVYQDDVVSNIKIIIDKPYHLSFPFIFEHDGNIYIMPETNEDKTVRLFRASEFPNKWVEDTILLNNVQACDTILFEKDKQIYLLANEMYAEMHNGIYPSCWVKNVLYNLDLHNFHKVSRTHVLEGDIGVRNAGAVFSDGDVLIRPGQNSPNNEYGKGVIFYDILSLNPYEEKAKFKIDCGEMQKHIDYRYNYDLIGFHTYNSSEHYEIIDFSCIRPLPTLSRIMYFLYRYELIGRVIRKIIRVLRKRM